MTFQTLIRPQILYTVSQKNIPDIFDCDLKTNCRILIIFGTNIPDTSFHQMTIQFPTSPNVCFCTTWVPGSTTTTQPTKYHFFPMRYDCLVNITRENTFLTLWMTFHPVVHFSTACSKIAWSVSPLCEHRQGDVFSIHWQQYR